MVNALSFLFLYKGPITIHYMTLKILYYTCSISIYKPYSYMRYKCVRCSGCIVVVFLYFLLALLLSFFFFVQFFNIHTRTHTIHFFTIKNFYINVCCNILLCKRSTIPRIYVRVRHI